MPVLSDALWVKRIHLRNIFPSYVFLSQYILVMVSTPFYFTPNLYEAVVIEEKENL